MREVDAITQSDRDRALSGFLLLDKPPGITSNRALQKVKGILRVRKAGHTGSLDPLATGMLPICIGAATKLSSYMLAADKCYAVTAALGTETDTGDADGNVTEKASAEHVTASTVEGVLQDFVGPLDQVPPMYSALKHQGKRLYRLARAGQTVPRPPRRIRVHRLELTRFAYPQVELIVHCSKGTYIRTLAQDIAKATGTLGHVTQLRRLWVDPFRGHEMITLEKLEALAPNDDDAILRRLHAADMVLAAWPRIVLDQDQARRLRNGQQLPVHGEFDAGLCSVYSDTDEFVGIGEIQADGGLRPKRIFL